MDFIDEKYFSRSVAFDTVSSHLIASHNILTRKAFYWLPALEFAFHSAIVSLHRIIEFMRGHDANRGKKAFQGPSRNAVIER